MSLADRSIEMSGNRTRAEKKHPAQLAHMLLVLSMRPRPLLVGAAAAEAFLAYWSTRDQQEFEAVDGLILFCIEHLNGVLIVNSQLH